MTSMLTSENIDPKTTSIY